MHVRVAVRSTQQHVDALAAFLGVRAIAEDLVGAGVEGGAERDIVVRGIDHDRDDAGV